MKLTSDQIDQFNQDGFLLIRDFASRDICDKILEKSKEQIKLLKQPIETEEEYLQVDKKDITLRRLRQVYERENIFQEWMTDQKIRPILKQLLGTTPVLTLAHHNSIMTKMPQVSSKTSWHQDKRYWNYEDDNLLSVWLALGDEFIENGLLEFIPGSHKMEFSEDQFDERTSFISDLKQNQEVINKRVHFELKKGDIVLFHCKTLHYASKNNTTEPKISFVYTVKGIDTKAIAGTRSEYKEIILD